MVALGAVTRCRAPGLREHAFTLKNVGDAIRLRNHVLRQIELADAAPDRAERRLTFVFAGAGFAGVETLAELQELTAGALRRHPRLDGIEPRWVLVDRAPRILGQTPEGLARFAARTLSKRGVELLTETSLESADARGVDAVRRPPDRDRDDRLDRGRDAEPAARGARLPLDEHGRVRVDETLAVEGMAGVWALGDCAAVPNAATPGETDPATCQHALRQARRLARNLRGEAKPYRYRTRARWPRSAAATASPPPARCASAASTAGSSPAPTTCWRCRSRRAARVSSPTGRPRPSSAATSWR